MFQPDDKETGKVIFAVCGIAYLAICFAMRYLWGL